MVFETTNRKQLASKMGISYTILWRYMKNSLRPEFLKQISGRILLASEAKYIYEEITGLEKWQKGSK